MGISDRDDGSRKWVIAGIQLRPPLKPIYTPAGVDKDDDEDEDEGSSTSTPTATDAVIPPILPCPPPPRKQKSTLKCNYGRDFFNPPDLETIFVVRHVERAS